MNNSYIQEPLSPKTVIDFPHNDNDVLNTSSKNNDVDNMKSKKDSYGGKVTIYGDRVVKSYNQSTEQSTEQLNDDPDLLLDIYTEVLNILKLEAHRTNKTNDKYPELIDYISVKLQFGNQTLDWPNQPIEILNNTQRSVNEIITKLETDDDNDVSDDMKIKSYSIEMEKVQLFACPNKKTLDITNQQLLDHVEKILTKSFTNDYIFVHGDIKPRNLGWREKEDGQKQLVMFDIDQSIFVTSDELIGKQHNSKFMEDLKSAIKKDLLDIILLFGVTQHDFKDHGVLDTLNDIANRLIKVCITQSVDSRTMSNNIIKDTIDLIKEFLKKKADLEGKGYLLKDNVKIIPYIHEAGGDRRNRHVRNKWTTFTITPAKGPRTHTRRAHRSRTQGGRYSRSKGSVGVKPGTRNKTIRYSSHRRVKHNKLSVKCKKTCSRKGGRTLTTTRKHAPTMNNMKNRTR